MRRSGTAAALMLALFFAQDALSQDPSALVREAISAHGGEAALAKWSNQIVEGDATFHFRASELTGTVKIFVRDGRYVRRESRLTFGGTLREFLSASTGKSAWRRFGARIYEYPVDDFRTWLRRQPDILLRAAKADADALRFAGRIDDAGAAVDLVEFDDEDATVRIALDAETHLVRSLSYKAMENAGEGKKEEVFLKKAYDDYRDVGGVPFPHEMEEFQDGVREMVLHVSASELGRQPEIALFAKPEPDEESKEWGDQIAD